MDASSFTGFDILVAIVLLIFGLTALSAGLVKMILFLGSWIGAAIITSTCFSIAQPEVHKIITVPIIADFVTFLGLFIGSLVLLILLSQMLSSFVKDSSFKILDKSLGFVFGCLLGIAVITTGFMAWKWLAKPESEPEWLQTAFVYPYLNQSEALLQAFLPEDQQAEIETKGDEVRKNIEGVYESGKQLEQLMKPVPIAPEQ